jgi:hypothetical protein
MRLLSYDENGRMVLDKGLQLNTDTTNNYAILSHTWGDVEDEVLFEQFPDEGLSADHHVRTMKGSSKIDLCGQQASKDKLAYFWVDTCCIDKRNADELQSSITSMFSWYRNAQRCYVYLEDVSCPPGAETSVVAAQLRACKWMTRGWTLQELIAPTIVQFYSREWAYLGDKLDWQSTILQITGIPPRVLRDVESVFDFAIEDRLVLARSRKTKLKEDKVYCLLGICNVSMLLDYGEGYARAQTRLLSEIYKVEGFPQPPHLARFSTNQKMKILGPMY